MTEDTLWVVAETEQAEEVSEPVDIEGRRSARDAGGGFGLPYKVIETARIAAERKRVPLDAKVLKTQMQGLIATVNGLFEQATTQTELQLNEVELSVEINAEGQISLVGNGGKLGSRGGITLKFSRHA